MSTAPDQIDVGGGVPPTKLPAGAVFNAQKMQIEYMGAVYNVLTGKRMDGESGTGGSYDDVIGATQNPLSLFGISDDEWRDIATRGGIILLGAALCIAGLVFVISGTKAAKVVASAVPVAGKVL